MRPPSDYAPPDAPMPGFQPTHRIKLPPIDLPDDFGTDETRRDVCTASIIAAALLLTFAIAAVLLLGAFA